MRRAALLAAAVSIPGLPASAQPEVPLSNWLLPGSTWQLVELNGAPFEARVTAQLTADGRIEGEAPCNAFEASYTGDWPDIEVEPVLTTRRTCPDQAQENAFLEALAQVDTADNTDSGLILTGPDGVALRLEPAS